MGRIKMDYYKCENCGKIFDEFEMNFKRAQDTKETLCRKCIKEKEAKDEL
jgi:DNA-directed RNA polymerase subunit RPC12/RpoP